jgi:RNA polymerase sigma-70 factor, ECF subfamily
MTRDLEPEQAPTGAPSVDDGLPSPTTTVFTVTTRSAPDIPEMILREYWLAASSSGCPVLTRPSGTCNGPRRMAEPPEGPEPGAPEDLEAVFTEVGPALLRMAERMCGNRADAEDVLQETFLRAVRHGIPPDLRNIAAWLTTMLKNAIVDHCRKIKRRPNHEAMTDLHDGVTQLEPDGPEPAWSRIITDDIRDALDAIEPVYREVYQLHTFEGRTYEQIARQLGIQRVTVGTRLNRARKKLREVLVARFGLETKP